MRVLMLADGSSIHTRRALDWHLKNGCEVTFVDYVDPKPQTKGIYRFVPYPRLRGTSYLRKTLGPRLTSHLVDRAVARGLGRIFRTTRPDVVHLYQIDERAFHCLRAGVKPLVMSSWGTDINQHFVSTVDANYRSRTAAALAGADVVIADASDIIEKCACLAGRAIRSELLPLGIDTELFRPGYEESAKQLRRRLDIPANAIALLSIRALTPLYGHEKILEAFHQAVPQFTRQAYLVFKAYNNHGAPDYEYKLRRRGEQLGVSDRLRWSAGVPFEQLPALYAAADAIINYPSMDGFPVTFLEAAACQRRVISNRLPAYCNTFAEKHFCMVESGDLGALVKAIVETVNDPVSKNDTNLVVARATVEKDYSEAVSSARLMAIYGDLSERKLAQRTVSTCAARPIGMSVPQTSGKVSVDV